MTRNLALIASLLASVAAPALAEGTRNLSGELTYLQRIALPEGAALKAEVHGPHDVILAEAEIPTNGAQVPLPFTLEIAQDVAARLTLAIAFEGQPRWKAPQIDIAAGTDDVALGAIVATPYVAAGFESQFNCEGKIVGAGFVNDSVVLTLPDGSQRVLPQVIAASGAKFADPDNPDQTFFWNKGENATMRIDGILTECAGVAEAQAAPWHAGGTAHDGAGEWGIDVSDDNYTLTRTGEDDVVGVLPAPQWRDGAVVWDVADPGMTLRTTQAICTGADGMPHPETVSLTLGDGPALQGCGGDPAVLLQGADWKVVDLLGKGVPSDGDGVIRFAPDGSVSGKSFCNNFIGSYEIGAEGLSMGHLASTLMICGAGADYREPEFLQTLRTAKTFTIADDGALELRGSDGAVMLRAVR
ncbi:putative secreted protein containing HslJ-like protein [Ketogulonicigenium robustum]|uniref:Putative secreted protein containing HslJ-like protein n=1 Tax=Ketogulonicigenium robustum TaxID=92947 RepID=A0A1W6P0Y2_9RHOB|nr:META domain-containing protein [Ketogulonicigenium robustum]ARO15109.1 putative secreted protein containing HslJ-like protein [Ketogulonicigenium robustum]